MLAAAQSVVFGEHAIEAAAELGRITAEEAQRLAQIFELVLERARGIASTLGLRIVARARARGRDAPHHVSNEATPPRFGIELAHRPPPCTTPRSRSESPSKPARRVPRLVCCSIGGRGREPHARLVKVGTMLPR